ncbi:MULTISPECIES: hypothetical protein [unclassified Clostridium]|uniref:hypothetical protein n=1 Tax=unclassified Clostridium TaxID=2614128 RepID=UPI0002984CDE|nr:MULTISPECIES: hypothetical protein [unclassified Clostridium]EKQ51501.1 MAG: hypothetical protein A370_04804 [Clostridium sp. Maddingley MBC34-26]
MKKIIISLISLLILFSLVGYSSFTKGILNAYNDSVKYAGINMKEIKEDKAYNSSGEEIGQRCSVTYNPDKITDESLSNFYKDKIKDSGYRYYTLINSKDKTQGIVSIACVNVLIFAEIDDKGSIVKATRNFEVK